MREVTRIEAIAKSPILNLFSEVVRGAFYVRNCVDREYLFRRQRANINKDLRNQVVYCGLNSFYQFWNNAIVGVCE